MAIKKQTEHYPWNARLFCFIKVCKTAITLPQALVLLVLLVQVPQVRVQVLVLAPELVQVPLLWRALPVSSLQPSRNQSLQMTVLLTTALKEQKQTFSSLTTLPPFKDFQMLGYLPICLA